MRISDWSSDVCSSDLDDLLDARFFLQPLHADADFEHRMFEQELVLDAAIARIPAEETETLPREIGGDIMLGKVHIIMGGDDRDLRTLARLGPIDALARMPARLDARRGRRHAADELRVQSFDPVRVPHHRLSCLDRKSTRLNSSP